MTRITWRRLYPDQAPGFTQLTSGLRDFHQNNNLSWDHWHIDTGNIMLAMVTKTFYTFQSKPDCPQALTVHCHSGNTDTDSTDSISFMRSLQTDRQREGETDKTWWLTESPSCGSICVIPAQYSQGWCWCVLYATLSPHSQLRKTQTTAPTSLSATLGPTSRHNTSLRWYSTFAT